MGRLGCKCGIVLSNVDCPTDVELWGFEKSDINKILETNPGIILTDAVMDHSIQKYYFWYCKDCGRVYVFRMNHQMYNRIYVIHDFEGNDNIDAILKLRELYFFTDRQVEEPSEEDFEFTLKAFLDNPPHSYRFFITPDSSMVYAYNTASKTVAHCYSLEEEFDDEVFDRSEPHH